MTELSEKIVAVTMNFDGSDYDQRSALGMARTWVEKGVRPEHNVNQVENKRRDDLAKELVAVFDDPEFVECDQEEQIAALRAARREVNAPFRQELVMGTARAKPKDLKKAKSE